MTLPETLRYKVPRYLYLKAQFITIVIKKIVQLLLIAPSPKYLSTPYLTEEGSRQ